MPGRVQQALSAAVPEWQTAAGGKMEFEVASVRPSKPLTPYSSNVDMDAMDGPQTGNLFTANAPIMAYLLFAYKISDSNQGKGIFDKLPAEWKSQFFHVDARSAGNPTRDQMRLMVQTLLADRFKLAIHRETQLREAYTVVLDKPATLGPQLQPRPADRPCVNNPDPAITIEPPAKSTDGPRYCGMVTWSVDGQRHLRLVDVTMAQIANYLSSASMQAENPTPHTGVDGTGLSGRFDLDIQFVPESDEIGGDLDASGPTFSAALRKQLGLRFIDRKAPVGILVIDHIEKPSDN